MAGEVVLLTEESFFGFVTQDTFAVAFLSVHPLHAFSEALPEQVRAFGNADVQFGVVSLLNLSMPISPVLQFLARAREHSAVASGTVTPGYYLFRGGLLHAYHTGLPARSDMNFVLRGLALGAVWYGFTGDRERWIAAVVEAANGAAAPRVAKTLAAGLSGSEEGRNARYEARAPSEDELSWAYAQLGVDRSATAEQVNAAWRKLRAANHPDHAGGDSVEFQRRTKLSQQLNRAREGSVSQGTRGRAAA